MQPRRRRWLRAAQLLAVAATAAAVTVLPAGPAQADAAGGAVAWAQSQLGSTAYDVNGGLCLKFVHDAYSSGAGVEIGQGYGNPIGYWNGHASAQHPGDTNPPAGALVIWGANPYTSDGHIAIAEGGGSVISSTERGIAAVHRFTIADRNGAASYYASSYLGWMMPPGVAAGGGGSAWIGKIVKWSNGGGAQNTSWVVSSNARRYWIPDTNTYYCMVGIGYVDAGVQSSTVLDSVPDSGQSVGCPVNPRGAQDRLTTGQGLYQGQTLTSGDGRYTLILQQDHNLVLYGPSGVVWATNRVTGGFAIMQSDCNVVGYSMWSTPLWATNTGGVGSGCTLVVQNDSNLVIYRGNDGRPVWDRARGRLV